METKFRFQESEIWNVAIELSDELFNTADILEDKNLFRFAEQLRGAVLSISNNIAEGSCSTSSRDFGHFLNIARRSVFETANMLIILNKRQLMTEENMKRLLDILDKESRMITRFRRNIV